MLIFVAALSLIGSLVALSAALGFITLPNGAIQQRVRVLTAEPESAAKTSPVDHGDGGSSVLERLTSRAMMTRIERNMVLAGRPEGWSRERVVYAKPLGAVLGTLFALVIITKTDHPLLAIFSLAIVVLGYFVPDLLIYNHAIKRQEEILKELPDTLDQIVISIEAGTGFESALTKAGEQGTGPLADEIVRLTQDMALGMSRRDAYLALADRTTVVELRNFAKAIVQAEEFGVSIASVVRTQAREMRIGRRTRAEAKAQQVPVKILIPLMTCVLPVLFIIVLGPAIVSAFANS
jgi:tight adherence protein C